MTPSDAKELLDKIITPPADEEEAKRRTNFIQGWLGGGMGGDAGPGANVIAIAIAAAAICQNSLLEDIGNSLRQIAKNTTPAADRLADDLDGLARR